MSVVTVLEHALEQQSSEPARLGCVFDLVVYRRHRLPHRVQRRLDNAAVVGVLFRAAELAVRVAATDVAVNDCPLKAPRLPAHVADLDDPDHYEKAALRWVGRFALEARDATLADVRAAADALARLPTDADDAMAVLERLWLAHRLA